MSHGRLARALVLIFLLSTGLDLASPQNCGEELLGVTIKPEQVARSSSASSTPGEAGKAAAPFRDGIKTYSISGAAVEDGKNKSPDQAPGDDDDCFCCCAHITPGMTLALISVPVRGESLSQLAHLSLPAGHLQNTYHPPRFV